MSKTPLTEPQQQLWHDLTRHGEPVGEDMEKWAEFVRGVTEYDPSEERCVWNGLEVFVDSSVPYTNWQHPDFTVDGGEDRHGLPRFDAWAAPELPETGVTPRDEAGIMEAASVPAPEMPVNLDYIVDQTTALRSMGELVEVMRGDDGYGQKYMPTLRPDMCEDPVLEEGLHAVRAEVQRLGFDVYPDDGFYAPRPDAEDIDYGHEEPPTLDELVFDQEGPDEVDAHAIVAATPSSLGAMSKEGMYVAVSRGEEELEPEEPDAYELDI